MPKVDWNELFTDPKFLASIGQITAGLAGSGAVGQGIGQGQAQNEALDLEKRRVKVAETEQEERAIDRKRSLELQEQNQYLTAIEKRDEDYQKRKVAAIADVRSLVDKMQDPTDYQKLPEILPTVIGPYRLTEHDAIEVSNGALARTRANDFTTFDPQSGEINVAPHTPGVQFLHRKEAVDAHRQWKAQQVQITKDEVAAKKQARIDLEKDLRAQTRAGLGDQALSNLSEDVIDRATATGIVSGEKAIMTKDETELRLKNAQIEALVKRDEKADKADKESDLTDSEAEVMANIIMANPSVINQMDKKGFKQVAPKLAAMGFSAWGKPMGERALVQVSESRSALRQLGELLETVNKNQHQLGPITGMESINPWSDKKKIQADLKRVAQNVGKAMEGGVLRREDTVKYQDMLAQIWDVPSTATYKIRQVIQMLANDIQVFIETQEAGGRETTVLKEQIAKEGGQIPETKGSKTNLKPAATPGPTVIDFIIDPKTGKYKVGKP